MPRLREEPDLADEIADRVTVGYSLVEAAEMSGVERRTVYDWFARGDVGPQKRGEDVVFGDFRRKIEEAREHARATTRDLRIAKLAREKAAREERAHARRNRTMLTTELGEEIADRIATGATFAIAARLSGVSYHTVREWRKRGLESDPNDRSAQIFRDFVDAIEVALVQRKNVLIGQVQRGARGEEPTRVRQVETVNAKGEVTSRKTIREWDGARLSAWLLERQYPDEFGRHAERKTRPAEKPPPVVVKVVPSGGGRLRDGTTLDDADDTPALPAAHKETEAESEDA